MASILTRLNRIGEFITEQLRLQIKEQGHDNTGQLVESVTTQVKDLGIGIQFTTFIEEYGLFVNKGRKAGTKKIPIDALITWVRQRAIATDDREVESIAYAIQEKIFQEGSPTGGSFRYSVNGKRIGFIEDTLEIILPFLDEAFEQIAFDAYSTEINELLRANSQ